ncbi:MMPL family transporter [Acidomonas methanolica]|uniref:MMPL family transporter n=1 Tax=Acidomonas methanolica TaxID=437 RepID=UPI00331FE4E0
MIRRPVLRRVTFRTAAPWRLALTLLASALFAAVVCMLVPVRTDMAGFLPQGQDAGARFLLREMQQGMAGTVITLGIDGADEADLARLSFGLRDALAHDARFVAVLDGAFAPAESEALRNLLFDHRYALATDDATRDFSPAALKQDLSRTIDTLGSNAATGMGDLLLRDPTGAFIQTVMALQPDVHVALHHGVWFASDHRAAEPRALLLIRTRAGGLDIAGQASAQSAIRAAFARLNPGSAHLVLSGPGVFAVASATAMRADIDMMAVFSLLIVATILIWRFRSLWVLAAIGVPFLLSLGVAMIVVRLVFGSVHGIAFGFGMTMLGVSLDYPVLLIGHRDRGEGPEATLHRIGRSLRLGVATAVLGLTGMIFCGLPGLGQLGLFAATGLVTAAAVTLLVMPGLIVSADLAPCISGPSRVLRKVEGWRRWRMLCLLSAALALGALALHPLQIDATLSALSPIPASQRALDATMRRELGAPDPSLMLAVSGADAQAVLQREEALAPLIARLRAQGAIAGIQDAARLLPSRALQERRLEKLPDVVTLRKAVTNARAGLPLREAALDGFMADVAAARAMPPLMPADLVNTPLGTALGPLLFERSGRWWGVILPEGVRDPLALSRAFAGQDGVLLLDIHSEMDGLAARYMGRTLRLMVLGAVLAVVVLALGLRDWLRVARVIAAVGGAVVTLLGLFALAGVRVTLVHCVALQFVVGVGLDYALFFARPQLDDAERARTMRTLLTCNAMTVLTFGLLGLCHTVILRHIGTTVAPGVILAMIFGFLLAGQRRETERTYAS